MKRVLEVNVDDLLYGGVFSLVKNVIFNCSSDVKIDIAAIERFENLRNIKELKKNNTEIFYIGCRGNKWRKQIVCYLKLRKLLKHIKYDCVHIHGDVANKLFVSGLASKHAGIKKIILHSHAAGVEGKNRKVKKLFHYVCRRFLKCIGTDYVACSDLAATWMFPNIKDDNIVIINNGVELNKFRFDLIKRNRVRAGLNLSDELVLGHVGRFSYQKNHEFLVLLMKRLSEKNKNIKLLLIGEGPEKEKIKKLIETEKIKDMFIFYGTSNHIDELMQGMDIFLLPSRFEGLPIAGVEAQASGLPVIYSDQISRNAKLSDNVVFLPTKENDLEKWIKYIEFFSKNRINRSDGYMALKSQKFDITDVVNAFLELYFEPTN